MQSMFHAFARSARSSLTVLGLALALSASAIAGEHVDERLGYKIKVPRKWDEIPLKTNEQWIAARFLSNKNYFWTDKATGWTWDFQPELRVIAFIDQKLKEEVEVDKKDADTWVVTLNNPYKDYEHYLEKTYSGGGWHISERKEGKVDGVDVTQLEITVERMSYTGPKRILTWIYHTPGVDIAVMFEITEGSYKKLKSDIRRTHKSFRLVERAEGSLAESTTQGTTTLTFDLDDLTPKERRDRRYSMEQTAHNRAAESLPEGWTAKKYGRFQIINHTDDRFAKRVADQAEAVWKWLDDNFGFIGPEEYVRAPIIRICKNQEEEWTFRKGGNGWWGVGDMEIVMHKDNSGSASWEMGYLNGRLLAHWFTDRDRDLYWAMPQWLRRGLGEVIEMARSKGRKVEFRNDDWNRDRLRNMARAGDATPPRRLMMMSAKDFDWENWQEAHGLVTFFVTGPASKSAKTKTVLEDYLLNLQKVIADIDAEESEGEDEEAEVKKPKTEEEEDAYFKARSETWKEREQRILEETWRRTFHDWTERDWTKFDKAYYDAIG